MKDILLARLAAVAIAAAVVAGCAVLEEHAPALDRAVTRAAKLGGCVKAVCRLPIHSLDDCGPAVGSCR